MLRVIVSVIVGYIAMATCVFVAFSGAYLIMGTEGAFQPASYDVSALWIFVSIVVGLLGGIAGGLVCASIAPQTKGPIALVIMVLFLGLAMAFPTLSAEQPETPPVRAGDIALFDAMSDAHQPKWITFLNPLLGMIGIAVGSRAKHGAMKV